MCFNTLSSRNKAILLASAIAHSLRDDPVKRLDWSHFQRASHPVWKIGRPWHCSSGGGRSHYLFNHAEVYHVAPNVVICPADVSNLMAHHDKQLF